MAAGVAKKRSKVGSNLKISKSGENRKVGFSVGVDGRGKLLCMRERAEKGRDGDCAKARDAFSAIFFAWSGAKVVPAGTRKKKTVGGKRVSVQNYVIKLDEQIDGGGKTRFGAKLRRQIRRADRRHRAAHPSTRIGRAGTHRPISVVDGGDGKPRHFVKNDV